VALLNISNASEGHIQRIREVFVKTWEAQGIDAAPMTDEQVIEGALLFLRQRVNNLELGIESLMLIVSFQVACGIADEESGNLLIEALSQREEGYLKHLEGR
jgi:hypothetical protein